MICSLISSDPCVGAAKCRLPSRDTDGAIPKHRTPALARDGRESSSFTVDSEAVCATTPPVHTVRARHYTAVSIVGQSQSCMAFAYARIPVLLCELCPPPPERTAVLFDRRAAQLEAPVPGVAQHLRRGQADSALEGGVGQLGRIEVRFGHLITVIGSRKRERDTRAVHLPRGYVPARLVSGNARIENVGKSHSCMGSK